MNCKSCLHFKNKRVSKRHNKHYGKCSEILIQMKLMFNSFLFYKKDYLTVFEDFSCNCYKGSDRDE